MTPEEYIKSYTRNCSNELAYKGDDGKPMYHPWLTPENVEEVAIMAKDEALKSLWKDAQGDDLPEIDREVIALIDYAGKGYYKVVFAHRPNPERKVSTSLLTGKKSYIQVKTYDKGGWNMEGVTYWLDVELPDRIE